jgi:hypothetical protein
MNGRQNDAVAVPAPTGFRTQTQTALNPSTPLNFIAGSQS